MIGTMNNPGTVIMTVSDLSEIEVEVEVDETDIANVKQGQEVEVSLDALPDTTFEGKVTEVGNSAQVSSSGGSDLVTNFIVTVLMTEITDAIRPGMSATCDITTAERSDVLKIPIGAVVLRDEKLIREQQKGGEEPSGGALAQETDTSAAAADSVAGEEEEPEESKELEGVFVIRDGQADFVEVVTGIADQQNIEIVSGLSENDEIVTGSFKILRELKHGDRVKARPSMESRVNAAG
jgi:HlyD family secretion protein